MANDDNYAAYLPRNLFVFWLATMTTDLPDGYKWVMNQFFNRALLLKQQEVVAAMFGDDPDEVV
jgi:hypothetical protein